MSDDVVNEVASSFNRFSVDFWKLAASEHANEILSPASVGLALTMVLAGAEGRTAEEIASALHLTAHTRGDAQGAVATLLRRWNGGAEGVELAVANRLFGERTLPFEADYLELTRAVFGAELERLDFREEPDAARTRINGWVEQKTRERIRDLLPSRAVTSETRAVLVNAITFKAPWASPFDPAATVDAPFFARGGERRVRMMRQTKFVRWGSFPGDGLVAVELPYAGNEFAMVVLLPVARDGLAALEAKLDAAALQRWVAELAATRVELALPKFLIKMPESLHLKAMLQNLGIKQVFDYTQADLTRMAPRSAQLEISEAFHKAFVAVDEHGTEAAAATAMGLRAGAALPSEPPERFIADHPFLYFLRDTQCGAILFLGRVAQP